MGVQGVCQCQALDLRAFRGGLVEGEGGEGECLNGEERWQETLHLL